LLNLGEYKTNKAFVHAYIIEAIKLDASYSASFTLLGHYYNNIENDVQRAGKCYLKSITINPKDEDATRSLCEIYILQNKLTDSFNIVSQFILVSPRSFWGWNQRAIFNLDNSKLMDSITDFQTALRINVKSPMTWNLLGEAYLQAGRYTASIKALDRSIENDNEIYIAYYNRAIVHFKLGMYSEAILDYKTVLEIISKNNFNDNFSLASIRGLIESYLSFAIHLFNESCFGRSLYYYMEAVELCMKSIKAYSINSQCIFKLLGDCCLSAVTNVPNLLNTLNVSIFSDCRDCLLEKFDNDIKKFQFNEIIEDSNLGLVLQCAGFAYQAAIITCAQSEHIGLHSLLARYYHDLAITFFRRCVTNEDDYAINSQRCINMALNFDIDEAEYWHTLAVICSKSHKQISQDAFIKGLELDPQVLYRNFKNAMVWTNLGLFYLINKDVELAKSCFKKAQFSNPELGAGWLGQACTARIEKSKEYFELIEYAFEVGGYIDVFIG
jgi:superkiller protein 3